MRARSMTDKRNKHRVLAAQKAAGQQWLREAGLEGKNGMQLIPVPLGRHSRHVRESFDQSLALLHYSGACQRVGRCMRLLIVNANEWVGGVVLGSTFPNIDTRDEALGLKRFVRDPQRRGLRSSWCRENTEYWARLQMIVNHARTFVFPQHQGMGIGINAHRLLLTQGRRRWEERYGHRIAAFDTLCDAADSGLFRRNGWKHVGMTAGYESNPESEFAVEDTSDSLRNNVALRRGKRKWEVWVRILDSTLME